MPDGLREGGIAPSPFKTPAIAGIDECVRLVAELDTEALCLPAHFLLKQPQFVVGTAEGDPQRQTDVCGRVFR